MNERFLEYLRRIGLTETLVQRVEDIYDLYARFCPEEISGIFVTDYVTKEGAREYENLWFFSNSYSMEAQAFIRTYRMDLMSIGRRVQYVKITKENFDFVEATKDSRINVQFTLAGAQFYGDLRASGNNCDYLMRVLSDHVMQNMAK